MPDPTDAIGPRDDADTTVASPARIYDYMNYGKDHYPADQEAAKAAEKAEPGITTAARKARTLMHRFANYLAQQPDIEQLVDIGTGIPTEPSFHSIVQGVKPEARILLVDFDKTVLRSVEGLAAGNLSQRLSYVHADIREPEKILDAASRHLDLNKPVALSLAAILHFISDDFDPYQIVRTLTEPLVAGSHLAISHVTGDFSVDGGAGLVQVYRRNGTPAQVRTHEEILKFFYGFELVPPGLVVAPQWHPELAVPTPWAAEVEKGTPEKAGDRTPVYAGVGVKR